MNVDQNGKVFRIGGGINVQIQTVLCAGEHVLEGGVVHRGLDSRLTGGGAVTHICPRFGVNRRSPAQLTHGSSAVGNSVPDQTLALGDALNVTELRGANQRVPAGRLLRLRFLGLLCRGLLCGSLCFLCFRVLRCFAVIFCGR